jgi:hypothetical protein
MKLKHSAGRQAKESDKPAESPDEAMHERHHGGAAHARPE